MKAWWRRHWNTAAPTGLGPTPAREKARRRIITTTTTASRGAGSSTNNIHNLTTTVTPPQNGSSTLEEDAKLTLALKEHLGCNEWGAVTALIPGQTRQQCRQRWVHFFDPALPRNNLISGIRTVEEDTKLRAAVQKYGDKRWVEVASETPGRTRATCRQRWVAYLYATDIKSSSRWIEDDAKLASAVRANVANWRAVAPLSSISV
jgi:hypothetical protein